MWRLQVSPNGNAPHLAGGVGVYLQLCSAARSSPPVHLTLRIHEHTFCCRVRFSTIPPDESCGFGSYGGYGGYCGERRDCWGAPYLLPHAELLADFEAFVPDGTMDVQVELLVIDDDRAYTDVCDAPDATRLADDLRMLLSSGVGADVALVCDDGGESLRAHSAVLSACSPVLAALLRNSSTQAGASTLRVGDDVTLHTLRQLLQFLYTDDLPAPPSREEATHLLNMADQYDVPRLFALCQRTLCDALTVDNAADTLLLAEPFEDAELLKGAALRFVADNARAVLATPGWVRLLSSRLGPQLNSDVLHTVVTGRLPARRAPLPGDADAADSDDGAARSVCQRVC